MKTLFKKLKRGFTIVELVIVIAVIAILAAVLIPTLANVINQAEESADMQTVAHLNTILSSYETVGDGAETISDAIEQADENGYNVSKLTPTSSGNILWDSETNRFLLVNSSGEVLYSDSATDIDSIESDTIYSNLWKIVNSSSEVTTYYSLYYSANYSGTLSTIEITDVGVDVSAYTANTVDIEYTGSSSTTEDVIVIIGNGGTVTLNDSGHDKISLYGTYSTVNANKVYTASLHIYGTVVGTVTVAEGHVVIESTATVNSVYVTNTSSVTITVSTTSAITIGSSGGSVSVTSTVTTNIETVTVSEETVGLFAGGLGTESSPYLISTAEQFANIGKFSDDMKTTAYYFELIDDIDLTELTTTGTYISEVFNGVLEGNNKTITCKSGLTNLFLYAMEVTEFNNFTVAWSRNNITRVFDYEGIYAETYENGIYVTETEIVAVSYDNVDFVGVTGIIYNVGGNNSALYFTNSNYWFWDVIRNDWNPDNNLVVVSGRTLASDTPASMVAHTQTIINCDVNANLTCSGYSAVFSGGQSYFTDTVISNCTYTGTFQGTKPGLLFANATGYDASTVYSNTDTTFISTWGKVTVENVSLYGNIIASESGGNVYFGTGSATLTGITTGASRYTLISEDSTLALSVSSDSKYVITAATTSCGSYYIQLHLGKVYWYDSTYTLTNDESSDMLLTIEVSTNNIANTDVYKATAISLKQAKEQGIVDSSYTCTSISKEGSLYSFVQYNETWYIIVDVAENYGMFASTENQCTAYVYGVTDSLPVCQSVKES